MIDPKILFWTGALANMVAIVVLAALGVRARRRGDIEAHARSMLTAASLVVVFLVAYVLKLLLLGREDMSVWSPHAVTVLRIHETCVLVMLVAGVLALVRGRALRATRDLSGDRSSPPLTPEAGRRHRVVGKVAVAAAVLGVLTAGVVLVDMYQRAGAF